MILADTVRKFSTEKFVDATDPEVYIMGKLQPFAEVTNSGVSSQRRVLETSIDWEIPASRCLETPEETQIIVGAKNVDYWFGSKVRYKYSTAPVRVRGSYGTVGQLLAGTPEFTDIPCFSYFVRRELDFIERSDYLAGYELYFPDLFNLHRGRIFYNDDFYFLLKSDTWVDGIGFLTTQVVRLEEPLCTVLVSNKEFDPVTESYTGEEPVEVQAFVVDMSDCFEFYNVDAEKIQPGDKSVSILKSLSTLTTETKIGDMQVLSVKDFGDYVTAHCR